MRSKKCGQHGFLGRLVMSKCLPWSDIRKPFPQNRQGGNGFTTNKHKQDVKTHLFVIAKVCISQGYVNEPLLIIYLQIPCQVQDCSEVGLVLWKTCGIWGAGCGIIPQLWRGF